MSSTLAEIDIVKMSPKQSTNELLKRRTEYLKQQNEQMAELLRKFGINSDKPLTNIQSIPETKPTLGNVEQLRRFHQLSEVRLKIEHQKALNARISSYIEDLKREVSGTKQVASNIVTLSNADIDKLDAKFKSYESHIKAFEKQFPCLRQRDYDLSELKRKTNELSAYKQQMDELMQDLNIYQGLKPDIEQAKRQLKEMKELLKN